MSSEDVLFIKTHTRSCTDVFSIVLFFLITYFNLIHCECLAACSEMLPKLFKSNIHCQRDPTHLYMNLAKKEKYYSKLSLFVHLRKKMFKNNLFYILHRYTGQFKWYPPQGYVVNNSNVIKYFTRNVDVFQNICTCSVHISLNNALFVSLSLVFVA